MKKAILGLAAAAAIVTSAGLAAADTQGPADISKDGDEGLYYKFIDPDALNATGNMANGGVIVVKNAIVRRTLIRPRASFVPEMVKSVEQI